MESIMDVEGGRLRAQRTGQLAATGDRHVQSRKARSEQCQCLEQISVTLYRVQIADRHDQLIRVRQPQLSEKGRFPRWEVPHAVRNGDQTVRAQQQISAQLTREAVRHGNDSIAHSRREPQSVPPTPPFGIVAAAMHGENVWYAGPSSCPRTIHGHGELMTMRECHSVTTE